MENDFPIISWELRNQNEGDPPRYQGRRWMRSSKGNPTGKGPFYHDEHVMDGLADFIKRHGRKECPFCVLAGSFSDFFIVMLAGFILEIL